MFDSRDRAWGIEGLLSMPNHRQHRDLEELEKSKKEDRQIGAMCAIDAGLNLKFNYIILKK